MDVEPKSVAPSPAGRRLYYGWIIVGTMFIVSLAQTAMYNPALSIFLKPITEELDWSRSTFAIAIGIGNVAGAGLAVSIGPILDRHGARAPVFLGFLILGGALMALSSISELWHFYAIVIANRAVIAGLLSIVAGVVVSKWFIRRRGRAMAFAITGLRFGQAIVPPYITFFLLLYGWRTAAAALGGFVWVLTLVPVILFLRRQPEDMGLQPDGDDMPDESVDGPGQGLSAPRSEEVSYTLKEALRTPAFYLILFATSALAFNIGGLNFNLFPFLTDQGLSSGVAAGILTAWSIVSVVGSIGGGFIAERLHVRFVMAIAFVVATAGIVALIFTQSITVALIFAAVHGLSFGALPMLMQLVWADYYGRRHQGAIRGFVTPAQVIVQAGGPIAGTLVFDLMDTYIPAFILFGALYVAAAGAMLLARPLRTPVG